MNKKNGFIYLALSALLCPSGLFATANAVIPSTKTLVVFYSLTGNTRRVAQDLAAALKADAEELSDKKDRSGVLGHIAAGKDAFSGNPADIGQPKYDPARYDMVILGTPIWSGNMTPALRTYITRNKAALGKIAVFTTSHGTKPDGAVKKIEELAGKKAAASAGFFAQDLKDKARYEEKLKAFSANLRQ
jgi:flavodoxin